MKVNQLILLDNFYKISKKIERHSLQYNQSKRMSNHKIKQIEHAKDKILLNKKNILDVIENKAIVKSILKKKRYSHGVDIKNKDLHSHSENPKKKFNKEFAHVKQKSILFNIKKNKIFEVNSDRHIIDNNTNKDNKNSNFGLDILKLDSNQFIKKKKFQKKQNDKKNNGSIKANSQTKQKHFKEIKKSNFRIKNVDDVINQIKKPVIKSHEFLQPINLSSIKQIILKENDNLFLKISKNSFWKMIKKNSSEIFQTISSQDNIKNMTEDQFNKKKKQKFFIVQNNFKPDPLNSTNKKILFIDFEGTIGFSIRSHKGYINFYLLENISIFFKKLHKMFYFVVNFHKKDSNGFYKKMMDVINIINEYVSVFTITDLSTQTKKKIITNSDKSKKKCIKKEKVKTSTINKSSIKNSIEIINISEIEKIFPNSTSIIFFCPFNRDVFPSKDQNYIHIDSFSLPLNYYFVSFNYEINFIFVKNLKLFKKQFLQTKEKLLSTIFNYEDKILKVLGINSSKSKFFKYSINIQIL